MASPHDRWKQLSSFNIKCHFNTCAKTLTDFIEYTEHLKSHYDSGKIEYKTKSGKIVLKKLKWLTCEQCGSISAHKSNFISHISKHTNDRPFMCEVIINKENNKICGIKASTMQNLQTHIKKVHKKDVKFSDKLIKVKDRSFNNKDNYIKKNKKKNKKLFNNFELYENDYDNDVLVNDSKRKLRSRRVRRNPGEYNEDKMWRQTNFLAGMTDDSDEIKIKNETNKYIAPPMAYLFNIPDMTTKKNKKRKYFEINKNELIKHKSKKMKLDKNKSLSPSPNLSSDDSNTTWLTNTNINNNNINFGSKMNIPAFDIGNINKEIIIPPLIIPNMPPLPNLFDNNNENNVKCIKNDINISVSNSKYPTPTETLFAAIIWHELKNEIQDTSLNDVKQLILDDKINIYDLINDDLIDKVLNVSTNIEYFAKKKYIKK